MGSAFFKNLVLFYEVAEEDSSLTVTVPLSRSLLELIESGSSKGEDAFIFPSRNQEIYGASSYSADYKVCISFFIGTYKRRKRRIPAESGIHRITTFVMKGNIKTTFLFITGIITCCMMSCKNPDDDTDKLKVISYEQSNEIFPNPERGFMHLYDVPSEGEGLNLALLNTLRSDNVTLIHRMYYFEKFKDQALSELELTLIREDMNKVREAGLKCILCFAYCGQGDVWNEQNGQDAPFTTIEIHLDQLKPVFEEHEDVIAFVQAGFIGPWGEWHSSTNGLETTYYKTKVLEKMLSVIPAGIMVQVRTPRYKQEIFGTSSPVDQTIAYTGEKRARVGHYNDCFMASADDYGTYINVETEKQYHQQ